LGVSARRFFFGSAIETRDGRWPGTRIKNNKTVAVKIDARSKMAKSPVAELPRALRGDLDASWIDRL
jgi:hypothetical protein